jgi:hypothetical protein
MTSRDGGEGECTGGVEIGKLGGQQEGRVVGGRAKGKRSSRELLTRADVAASVWSCCTRTCTPARVTAAVAARPSVRRKIAKRTPA